MRYAACLLILALAACGSPGGEAEQAADAPAADIASNAPDSDADAASGDDAPASDASGADAPRSAVIVSLEGEGLRFVARETGSARALPFGTGRDAIERAVGNATGLDPARDRNGECPAGRIEFTRYGDLKLNFQKNEFVGWSIFDNSDLTTMDGIGVGSTRAEIEDGGTVSRPVDSTLGEELAIGDMSALLDGPGDGARVTDLWAGDELHLPLIDRRALGELMTVTTAPRMIESFDGVKLAVHETGEGRPLMLLHGLFSNTHVNWVKYGHAETLAKAGYRVIMPDLRAHGDSEAPHDPDAYPQGVLVRDALHLIDALGLDDYDLGGFSLGARTVARLLSHGAKPRRAILSGMGLAGLTGWDRRRDFFVDVIDRREALKRGDEGWLALQFMKTTGADPVAARHLLCAVEDDALDFAAMDMPVLVLCGREDRDNGDPEALAQALPDGELAWVDGTHMSCIVKPELGEEMVRFLAA